MYITKLPRLACSEGSNCKASLPAVTRFALAVLHCLCMSSLLELLAVCKSCGTPRIRIDVHKGACAFSTYPLRLSVYVCVPAA